MKTPRSRAAEEGLMCEEPAADIHYNAGDGWLGGQSFSPAAKFFHRLVFRYYFTSCKFSDHYEDL